jgi:hypothetical protein
MKKLSAVLLAVLLAPSVAGAHELGFKHKHPLQTQAALGPIETLSSQILAGKLQEIEDNYMGSIAGGIGEISRLHADARRRNDGVAASCVEQKLTPAQNLRSAARKAATRLRSLESADIQALNTEAKTLSTTADRVLDLAMEARACLKLNSGQMVSKLAMTPEIEPEDMGRGERGQPDDSLVPRRPEATGIR